MSDFVSEIKTIPYNEDRIFGMLSDLSNLERVKFLKIKSRNLSLTVTLAVSMLTLWEK